MEDVQILHTKKPYIVLILTRDIYHRLSFVDSLCRWNTLFINIYLFCVKWIYTVKSLLTREPPWHYACVSSLSLKIPRDSDIQEHARSLGCIESRFGWKINPHNLVVNKTLMQCVLSFEKMGLIFFVHSVYYNQIFLNHKTRTDHRSPRISTR